MTVYPGTETAVNRNSELQLTTNYYIDCLILLQQDIAVEFGGDDTARHLRLARRAHRFASALGFVVADATATRATTSGIRVRRDQQRAQKILELQALISEGIESGVSEKSMGDILAAPREASRGTDLGFGLSAHPSGRG
jgi:hypothetical protein